MNKIKEYSIFPGQIKINDCTYFGLDYDLTDFVNNLAEKNKKYKEVIDKVVKWVADYKDQWIRNDEVVDDMNILLDILKEVK